MKFRLIALAAIAAAGSAHALTPSQVAAARAAGTLKEVVIHGASAQTNLIAGYMGEICATGSLDVFQSASNSGKDYKAYACNLKATVPGTGGWPANTPVLVIKRDLGGSIYGVNPVATQTPQNTMVVDGSCTGTASPWTCSTVALRQAVAGLSDVEPGIFSKTLTVGTTAGVAFNLPSGTDDNGTAWAILPAATAAGLDVATANQTIFGLAVSPDLRNALQAAQGLSVGATDAANMPSVPRAFYTAAASGFVRANDAKLPGWDALTGNPADKAKTVNLCRRANGSGTQASSNLFFLEAGTITTTSNGAFFPQTAQNFPSPAVAVTNGVVTTNAAPVVTGPALAVIEAGSTGLATGCLTPSTVQNADGTQVSNAGMFAIGVISFENIAPTSANSWSFVKLDGQAPSQAAARVGAYPYVYSATMQWKKTAPGTPDTGTKAFLVDMRKNLGTPAKIAGLTSAAAKQGVLASPSSYTGSCASQVAGSAEALYGSCVERLDFASAYNDGVVFYGLASTAAYKTNSSQPLHIVK